MPDFSKPIALFCPYCLQVSFLPPRPQLHQVQAQWGDHLDIDLKCGMCGEMIHLDSEFKLRQDSLENHNYG
jgi:hypothetical protein